MQEGYWEMFINIFLKDNRYMLLFNGLKFTLIITILSGVIGLVFGVLLALMRLSNVKIGKKFKPLEKIATSYIDLVRGTPVVVQLMLLNGVIFVGALKNTPVLYIGALAFGLNSAAYIAEIIRAGIEGLDKGQMEAARSLGMPYSVAMKEIIIPQAIKAILPALVSEFITLLKETSVVSFIGGNDLFKGGREIAALSYRGMEPYLMVAVIYLILTGAFTKLMRILERWLKKSD